MNSREDQPLSLDYPELIVAIAGPIGVDMDLIASSLESEFDGVGYKSSLIKLTAEMDRYEIPAPSPNEEKWEGDDTYNTYMRKMSEANALRKHYEDPAVLARIAIQSIRSKRQSLTGRSNLVKAQHVYIIRQLKRPEEVSLLRKVYGRQFVLASAYAQEKLRKEQLCRRLSSELSTSLKPADVSYRAEKLIERDAAEDEEALGQHLRETFHLADVFIDGLDKSEMDKTVKRFVEAFFGKNDISPTKDEYGMYAAKSASLRSADLSRQVGAAIFSQDGELITQGCNEVPKAGGGSYWDTEKPDHRDVKKGFDPNEHHKKELLRDLIERFRIRGYLSDKALEKGNDAQIVEELIAKKKPPEKNGALVGSKIMDLTEYGRVVHAEMLAVTDAARLGRSIKGATLYCTTFPCHNCTKHLLAAGIAKLVYMEPYPKSRAKDLHPDEIELEVEVNGKVGFIPFLGISPFRYRDIFQKGKRKADNGTANPWYTNKRRPMIEVIIPSYLDNEVWGLAPLLGDIKSETSETSTDQEADE